MKPSFSIRHNVAVLSCTATGLAAAHDGHGLPGSHWHASDTWGFVACAVALALALWLSRGGK